MIRDGNGDTSFHVACRHGNVKVLRLLLASQQSRDVQLDVENRKGRKILQARLEISLERGPHPHALCS